MEANFARVLIREGIPYEYKPKVIGFDWVPSFRLLRPLWNLAPAGWVEVVGWRQRDGFLPRALTQRIARFQQETGETVFVVHQNGLLWKALEDIYSPQIEQWEGIRRTFDEDDGCQ